jgi:hypothetical protein
MDDPMVFRPPVRGRIAQLAIGLPLTLLLLGIAAFVMFLIWVPQHLSYEVADSQLTVTTGARPFQGRHTLPLVAIARADQRTVTGGRKVSGTNLPDYCVGVFFYPELGRVWQATDCGSSVVLLELGHGRRPWLLSPADPGDLLAAVRTGTPYRGAPPPAPPPSGWDAALMVTPLLTLLAAVLTPALFIMAPRRLRYRIHSDGVDITTILRTVHIPTIGCTARRHTPKVGIRLWGAALPGYFTGRFRADGATTRIYATTVDDGVLIEGEDLRLFVSPADPEAFLEALQEAGATRSA